MYRDIEWRDNWMTVHFVHLLVTVVIAASTRHKRGDRALSAGSQHRSLHAAVSELAPRMPLFQGNIKKILVIRRNDFPHFIQYNISAHWTFNIEMATAISYYSLFNFQSTPYPPCLLFFEFIHLFIYLINPFSFPSFYSLPFLLLSYSIHFHLVN